MGGDDGAVNLDFLAERPSHVRRAIRIADFERPTRSCKLAFINSIPTYVCYVPLALTSMALERTLKYAIQEAASLREPHTSMCFEAGAR